MLLFLESGPKKNIRVNGFTKTVTLHLRSIGPNVQRHMAYFVLVSSFFPSLLVSPHGEIKRLCSRKEREEVNPFGNERRSSMMTRASHTRHSRRSATATGDFRPRLPKWQRRSLFRLFTVCLSSPLLRPRHQAFVPGDTILA